MVVVELVLPEQAMHCISELGCGILSPSPSTLRPVAFLHAPPRGEGEGHGQRKYHVVAAQVGGGGDAVFFFARAADASRAQLLLWPIAVSVRLRPSPVPPTAREVAGHRKYRRGAARRPAASRAPGTAGLHGPPCTVRPPRPCPGRKRREGACRARQGTAGQGRVGSAAAATEPRGRGRSLRTTPPAGEATDPAAAAAAAGGGG